MPHFNLRHFVQTLGAKRGREAFVLQIGAMDGELFDPMHEYITQFEWSGLLVEPVPAQFERLQETYKNQPQLQLSNVAIADEIGTASMYHLPTQKVDNREVPKWGYGTTSFYNDRNALAFDEVKDHIEEITVQTTTLPALLEEHKVQEIDVLQIDVEGHDYQVLKQFDFNKYHPLIINMEIINLPKAENTATKRLLDKHGYYHTKAGYDVLAISSKFFKHIMP